MSRSMYSFVALVAATLAILFWQTMGVHLLHSVSTVYRLLMHSLQPLVVDHTLRQGAVVIIASLLFGLVPVFIYWVVKRRWLYEYMTFVWCIWIILMTMILIKQSF